jgi:hypothetical protein
VCRGVLCVLPRRAAALADGCIEEVRRGLVAGTRATSRAWMRRTLCRIDPVNVRRIAGAPGRAVLASMEQSGKGRFAAAPERDAADRH